LTDPQPAGGTVLPTTYVADPRITSENCIEFRIPARSELRRVARLVVSSVGALAGFDVEEIADLRLAADELCMAVAVGALDECRIDLVIRWADSLIELACSASPVGESHGSDDEGAYPAGLDPAHLSERILEALADEFAVEAERGGTRSGWLRKTR
jgi:hypothetical protein